MGTGKNASSKKGKRVLIAAICVVVVAVLAFGLWYFIVFNDYKKDVAAIRVQSIDLTTVKDGEYYGDCDVGLVGVKVRVVVKGGTIADLELVEHKNGRGESAEVLTERIIKEQRIDVDGVTGATASSNVIREAVYNALTGERTIP